MMSLVMSLQVLLTLAVTTTCMFLAFNYVVIDQKNVRLAKWAAWIGRVLFVAHAIAIPAAVINVIWSF